MASKRDAGQAASDKTTGQVVSTTTKGPRLPTQPLEFSGSPTWARTRDLRINSPALYQLSYRGTASNYSGPTLRGGRQRSVWSDRRHVLGAIGNR